MLQRPCPFTPPRLSNLGGSGCPTQATYAAKTQKERLTKNLKRHAELDVLIKKLYEDKVAGALSAKRFEILSREYEDEQESLERQIIELQTRLEQFKEDGERANKFIEIVRRYTNFDELTAPMLNEYVEKIVVHEAEGERKGYGRTQKVEIYLNFIGKFEVPGQEKTEAKPFDPVEHQRAIWRKCYHKNRDRILAERRERTEERKAAKLAEKMSRSPAEIEAEVHAKYEKKRAYQREYQREWKRRRKQAVIEVTQKEAV